MIRLVKLVRDSRGAAAIEMAIALPILVIFIYGIFQVGVAFQAVAGMQHALGEGARLATICQNPTAAGVCSTASNTDIKTKITQKVFGTGVGTFSEPSVVDGAGFKTLSVTFTMPMNFLFFQGPAINLTRSKKVYVAT